MTPAQWTRVNALFDSAVERSAATRAAYVRSAAADDPAVAAEVLALLGAHDQASSFLATPIAHLSPASQLSRLSAAFKANRLLAPGDIVGDFQIVRLLGEGAFAHVYMAQQRSLDRMIALKVTAHIGREARTMAGLEHDHIVQVYAETIDPSAGMRMICMQLVTGTTLQHLIQQLRRLAPEERCGARILDIIDATDASTTLFNAAAVKDRESLAQMDFNAACLWIGARLAEALAFAHARGILHLDVKPANILMNRYGRPMLTDFNVALTPEDLARRDPSRLGGTVAYMSPEHFEAFESRDPAKLAGIDGRADIFALGIVLTELLTCRGVERAVDVETGTSVLRHTEHLPEEIASVLHLATHPSPRTRFPDAGELANALENCREMGVIRAKIPSGHSGNRLLAFAERRPVAAICALAAGPQLLGSLVNITYNASRVAPELTLAQQKAFQDLILPFNAVFYPLGIWLVWRQLAFLVRSLKTRHDRTMPDPETMAALRRKVLGTPYFMLFAASLGWLPGAILFPALIDFLAGPLGPHVYLHLLVAFVSSWLIAVTYSVLLVESVTLIVLYPRFWTGCCNIRGSSRFELRPVNRRLQLFEVLAGMIPLAGAMMIVSAGPMGAGPTSGRAFQVLVVGLILLGMCGFVFATKITAVIKRTVAAFLE